MEVLSKKGAMLLASCIAVFFSMFTDTMAYPGARISFETFYHELEPYGTWVEDMDYGYVWVPDVPRNFQPYVTDGHWIMTEYGNTWVSDYVWGWAPFHYGRWRFDDYYGWVWIPGTEWGPAWVAWRSGGGYYGWAPLGPGVNIHISINIGNYIPSHHWVFVKQGYISHPRIYRYCAPRRNVTQIIHHTTIINNTYVYNNNTYYTGPRARDIERATHQRVKVHRIQHMDRPGATVVRNGAVSVYRPAVSHDRGKYVPASSRNREAVNNRNTPSRNSYTPERQQSSSARNNRVSGGERRQGTDYRRTEGSIRSDQPGSSRSQNFNKAINNTPSRVRENIPHRNRETPVSRSSHRDRDASSYQNREHTPSNTRGGTFHRSGNRVNTPDRSTRTVSPNNRATPTRGNSQVSGQQQRRSSSSIGESRSSRPSAGQSQSRAGRRP